MMKKIYWIKCIKYRKFKNPKILYIFDKTLVLSIICGKCSAVIMKKVFKEDESIEILINNTKG